MKKDCGCEEWGNEYCNQCAYVSKPSYWNWFRRDHEMFPFVIFALLMIVYVACMTFFGVPMFEK